MTVTIERERHAKIVFVISPIGRSSLFVEMLEGTDSRVSSSFLPFRIWVELLRLPGVWSNSSIKNFLQGGFVVDNGFIERLKSLDVNPKRIQQTVFTGEAVSTAETVDVTPRFAYKEGLAAAFGKILVERENIAGAEEVVVDPRSWLSGVLMSAISEASFGSLGGIATGGNATGGGVLGVESVGIAGLAWLLECAMLGTS
jgi:hypothetical protein